jgi:pyroglutamyl-peptidase
MCLKALYPIVSRLSLVLLGVAIQGASDVARMDGTGLRHLTSYGTHRTPRGSMHKSSAATTTSSGRATILVTGFEPFGGEAINSSWEAVRRLNGLTMNGAVVRSVELPVLWHGAAAKERQAIDLLRPVLVINVGQGGPVLSLERYAHNHNDAIADNAGAYPTSSVIAPHGLGRYATSLSLPPIARALASAGIRNVISGDAGGYLCNYVSYETYAYLASLRRHTPALFVHVPPVHDRADTKEIAMLSEAIFIVLQQSTREWSQTR